MFVQYLTHELSYLKVKVLSAEAPERVVDVSTEKLHTIIKDQGKISLF